MTSKQAAVSATIHLTLTITIEIIEVSPEEGRYSPLSV